MPIIVSASLVLLVILLTEVRGLSRGSLRKQAQACPLAGAGAGAGISADESELTNANQFINLIAQP